MPVNILYIIDSLTHGGTEKQLVQLIRHLDRERFRPHICTLKNPEDIYNQFDIPKICLNFISFAHPSIIRNIISLNSFIRQNKIHIVQTFFQDPFLLAALIKPFHKIKLIGSFRDLGFWRTKTESLKMSLACRFFDGFIANSQAVKENFCAMDGIAPHRIEVVYNGFDLATIPARIDSPRISENPMVGIVANLNRPVKRMQDFVVAAAQVHRMRPDVRFLVVGGGHLQSDLERQAATLGIEAVTTFTGMVPNPLDYIARLSVGVITSETEGFCNALIEYMACGLPVVATLAGGNIEMVRDGDNGFLYVVGRVDQLSQAILRLLNSPETCNRFSALNRQLVPEQFSLKTMVDHTSTYYERVLSGETA